MEKAADNILPARQSLKDKLIPLEQRESQNVKATPFIKDWATILGLTGIGIFVGHFAGKALEPRKISMGRYGMLFGTSILDAKLGKWVGGKIGGLYGIYNHWRKTEGRRLGINNLSSDLKTAIDSAQLEKETLKEQAIIEGLQRMETLQHKNVSHTEAELTRRSTPQDTARNV